MRSLLRRSLREACESEAPHDSLLRRGPRLRYDIDRSKLPPELCSSFCLLSADEATATYISSACSLRSVLADVGSSLVAALLKLCLTHADTMALFHETMFACSAEQARRLLDAAGAASCSGGSMLDVGAADGATTARLAAATGASRVCVTEVSRLSALRLAARGYDCAVEEQPTASARFGLLSCLNVLDRTARPLTLLRRLRDMLAAAPPGGVLLLGVALPFRPAVLAAAGCSVPPTERLPPPLLRERRFEESVALFADLVLSPLGLRVSAWSRLPYLSRQIGGGVAVLDDALFCLAIDGAAGEGGQGAGAAPEEG
mmetsp:Transcript_37830/g.122043  ORF Transcript_37830/g.122043 Transcript_37830/m.122043 type:complete len:316 (-) Transcript_37830:68-1015(-)